MEDETMQPIINQEPEQPTNPPAQPKQEEPKTKENVKMSENVDLNKLSVEELEELLERKKEEEEEKEEQEQEAEEVDLNTLSDEELEEVLNQRKAAAIEASKKKATLKTVTMEEAFKLAKEYELDSEYSIKFGYSNAYRPWMRWISDNNLDLTPFVTWYDSNARKVKHVVHSGGTAKITLYCDGEVIETYANEGGSSELYRLIIAHCK